MPLYEVKCNICGKHQDIYLSLANFDNIPECCGQITERVISAARVIPDIDPYISQATGEVITSRSRHREHLIENGLIEVGNDTQERKPSYLEQKQQKEALRREIAQRIDSI
jgi:hypothetical protein